MRLFVTDRQTDEHHGNSATTRSDELTVTYLLVCLFVVVDSGSSHSEDSDDSLSMLSVPSHHA